MRSEEFDEVFQDNAKEKGRYSWGCVGYTVVHRENHTVGDYARWHPHLHALVADCLLFESGYFFVMPKVDLHPLRELFRVHVLKILKKEGLIDDTFIQMFMSWRHVSGFNVHKEVRIKTQDEQCLENLAQYIIRNTFSLEKLKYEAGDNSVIYRSRMTHGGNKRNFQVFSFGVYRCDNHSYSRPLFSTGSFVWLVFKPDAWQQKKAA